ncbi:MAG TPA: molybdopterin-binding protein, partial [Victivallales bacterium]|nr:molybdopterin-binding protein [Victivallales bacterium]
MANRIQKVNTKKSTKKSRVAILTIGNELLSGSTVNSNTSLIGQALAEFGVEPEIQISVPDDGEKISEALENLAGNPGLIISTGGLGPTSDDITKKIFATAFGLRLERDKDTEKKIRGYWAKRRRGKIPPSVFNQADLIVGAQKVDNDVGTAPGFIIRSKAKNIVLLVLPGPPSEAMPMLKKVIKRLLCEAEIETGYCCRVLSSGIAESIIEGITEQIIKGKKNLTPAYCASVEGVRIYLKSKNSDLAKKCATALEKRLGSNLIGLGAENV